MYDGHAIGSIAVVDHDDKVGKAQIGYCIGRNWWHMGIVSEALMAVMDFLFDEVVTAASRPGMTREIPTQVP